MENKKLELMVIVMTKGRIETQRHLIPRVHAKWDFKPVVSEILNGLEIDLVYDHIYDIVNNIIQNSTYALYDPLHNDLEGIQITFILNRVMSVNS